MPSIISLCASLVGTLQAVTRAATETQASPAGAADPSAHPILVACIAAGGALFGVVLKDLIFKLFDEHRAKDSTMRAIYSRYSDPLAESTTRLMVRLDEILNKPGRGRFLKLKGTPATTNKYSTYGTYKKISTLYRLAELLGWIRACRRENSYIKVAEPWRLRPIEGAIELLEGGLADGPAVETQRLTELLNLWRMKPPVDEARFASIAVDLEGLIDDHMQATDEIRLLTDEQKTALNLAAAQLVSSALATRCPSADVLRDCCSRALQIMDIKEAWIYRDWQSAIGDMMLRPLDDSERRFEVIGFSEFEAMCLSGSEEHKKWIGRISAVFDEIDLSCTDPFDHRPNQLGSILKACAALTLALHSHVDEVHIRKQALELAGKLSKGAAQSEAGNA